MRMISNTSCPVSYSFGLVTGGRPSWRDAQLRAACIPCGPVGLFCYHVRTMIHAELRGLCFLRLCVDYAPCRAAFIWLLQALPIVRLGLTAYYISRLGSAYLPAVSGSVCFPRTLLGARIIETVYLSLSQPFDGRRRHVVRSFCGTYNIPAELRSELPGRDDTIKDALAGKISIYTSNGWLSFSRRDPMPCCLLKKNDSLKNWNDHFLWINASIYPISIPWHASAFVLMDILPSDNRVNVELLSLLDHHRTVDERDMGLLDFVKSTDPFKVKTGERMLAEGEILLNDETVNMTIPPSANIIQIVEHTIVDELKEHDGKKKRKIVFDDLPTNRLRADTGVASKAVPATGSKSLDALRRLEL
ncbi:hypothetical protein Tco_0748168 [Tanacetum coccineum]|uniref:Uncharacterized protein n=1 Tax=Tanacetum coccineum TaxID=301880 RepID=A0ABQ4YXV6_9ASTR